MILRRTDNLRIEGFEPLVTPMQLKHIVPLTESASEVVSQGREEIIQILQRKDPRLLMVVGPCSIHDPAGALD